ncbi:MAG: hypothetical protein HOV79_11745 [Hamadaea sp.]|nr:hypothetical protein [Hamadaea sp.]
MEPIVGVKCYGFDWINKHGLSMRDAASWLRRSGVDWALVQNLIDPVPGSEVAQQPPAAAYNDEEFRHRLRDEGLKYFETTVMFHDPAADPGLRPVDQHGRTFTGDGWYAGLCPSDPGYLTKKVARVADAAERLRPDGVFVSFIRFPGFWELWMPGDNRDNLDEYCFCARCLRRFEAETGHALPRDRPARTLLHELRREWTDWKCGLIADAVGQVRAAVDGIPVMLNGFGLGGADFGNAVEEILAQRFADLDPFVDVYELMFYFQIQRRDPAQWIPARIAEARKQTARPLLACLQGGPEYLAPRYAAGRRSPEITDGEWRQALRAAARADGVLVYSWRDLLRDPARVTGLLDYRHGLL